MICFDFYMIQCTRPVHAVPRRTIHIHHAVRSVPESPYTALHACGFAHDTIPSNVNRHQLLTALVTIVTHPFGTLVGTAVASTMPRGRLVE